MHDLKGPGLQNALLAQRKERDDYDMQERVAGGQAAYDPRSLRSDIMRDPKWSAFFESIRGAKLVGGRSDPGSNQIQGVEGDLRGRPSLSALQSILNDPYSSFHNNAQFPRMPKGRR